MTTGAPPHNSSYTGIRAPPRPRRRAHQLPSRLTTCTSNPKLRALDEARAAMNGTTSAPAAGEKPHAVCVPFPAQGHVTPMMKLAKILHTRGFHVTFVNSEYNHRRLVRSRGPSAVAGLPGFRFATIPDGLPESDADATQDTASLCYSTMTTCLPHFRALLADLNRRAADGVPPVSCVVADGCLTFSVDAAAELGVPCALLWTASACGALAYHHLCLFIDKGIVPLKGHSLVLLSPLYRDQFDES
ncbi:hypothetical protein HU200_009012 [Digitaria exilis]|uniref:Glycosyltransferase N-terminal domain-containing protein n=1 Tax=Digitaria exilis TaxID=1010633 RepID=A0A835FMS1_9POAL|nr:hypothetical protein HU200_062483 [Digitaria exilis]KAF8762844.1 hypothetical protein HU200_009012 [Digitaria exilis]